MEKHRPPEHNGYPIPQPDYQGPQGPYPGPGVGYQGPQGPYPGPQAGYPVPPGGYAGAGPGGFPVQNQPAYNHPSGPGGTPWMPTPPLPLNCPPGLEYLTQFIQKFLTGFETNNKYEIKNSLGQRVYFAVEDTDCCTRNCCGASRPFTLRILDNLGQEVMTLERPLRCSSCCFPCCLQEIEIQAPPGVPVGYVTQTWHPCLPKFTLQNEKKQDVLKVVGPCVACSCCSDVDFELKSLNEETVVGKISKQWSGLVKEAFTDADNFGIQFPLDLDVKMKAVMLGACFLIDFMFFERTGNEDQRAGVWQ
ncbi:phospholipid scramblase 1 isoform X1 [Cricetulus griseus]|uniref:phospholipid scramblase 1 isoform X1 n=1 Tax=Cricetulus griseus TaxID=10029 RepID=UPI0015C386CA|nr:phospholipid scramblase 1 isoform X1 [Cricetulus griseus]